MVGFTKAVDQMPVLGVGVSLSLGTQPDPIALGKSPQGPDFIEYAGAVDVSLYHKEVTELKQAGIPLLYHPSCLNLCGPWPNPSAWLKQVNTRKIRRVSMVGSRCRNLFRGRPARLFH